MTSILPSGLVIVKPFLVILVTFPPDKSDPIPSSFIVQTPNKDEGDTPCEGKKLTHVCLTPLVYYSYRQCQGKT
jgi:hypothetical protein